MMVVMVKTDKEEVAMVILVLVASAVPAVATVTNDTGGA